MRSRLPSFLLWLTLVFCAPLPFFLVEFGRQPVAAVLQMLVVSLTLIVAEGSSGALPLTVAILSIQIVLQMAFLAVVATVGVRVLQRFFAERTMTATCVAIAAILFVSFLQPIYLTPFRTGGLRATLSEVFE